MKSKNLIKRLGIWSAVIAVILSIPFFTHAPWTSFDYIFGGSILFTAALIYEISTLNIKSNKWKIFIAFAVLGALLIIQYWAVS